METKNQEIIYTLPESRANLSREMLSKLGKVTRLSDTLKRWQLPYDVEGVIKRVEIGAEYERNSAIKEVEEYITKTKAPEFLRAGMRQTAFDSVPEKMIKELENALNGWDNSLTRSDLEFNGSWSFTESYLQRKEKELERQLDMQMTKDFPEIQQLFVLWAKHYQRYNLHEMVKFSASDQKDSEQIAISMVRHVRGTSLSLDQITDKI